jgi:hypothetical protein
MGCSVGSLWGMCCQTILLLEPGTMWNCPGPKRQELVGALIGFLHAILPIRGPVPYKVAIGRSKQLFIKKRRSPLSRKTRTGIKIVSSCR